LRPASVWHWQRRSGSGLHSGPSAAPPAACRRQRQTEAQRKTIFSAGKVIAGLPPDNAFAGIAPVNRRLTAGAGPRFRLSRQPTRRPHDELNWIGSWLIHPGRSAQEYAPMVRRSNGNAFL